LKTQNTNINILVTGAGGDLGQAIIKSLRLINIDIKIWGSDADKNSIGHLFSDEFVFTPHANNSEYIGRINDICVNNEIDAIVPGSEPEIYQLSYHKKNGRLKVKLICQDYDWLMTYGDKLECFKKLKGKVPLVAFADGENVIEVAEFLQNNSFPYIVKSRVSSGSKSLNFVTNKAELLAALKKVSKPIIQAYIDDESGEFSLGVFSSEELKTAIVFKRDLGPIGASWYADNYDQDISVIKYSKKIADIIGLKGSCNIQVRKNKNGVFLLEINPRFSSLVAARAACGFRDLEWSLKTTMGIKLDKPKEDYKKIRFRRYFNELIDYGEGYTAVDEWQPLKD